MSELPQKKRARLAKASKVVLKVAGQHAVHMAKTPFRKDTKKANKAHHEKIAKEIFNALATLKGTALKAAQLVSLELSILPEEMQTELRKACYQSTPLNRALVRKVIQSQLAQAPEQVFKSIDLTAFAAASIGQVHRAKSHQGRELAVKIQYPGIHQTIESDMKILRVLLGKLPVPILKEKSKMIHTMLAEVEARFLEETDYQNEAQNIDWFRQKNTINGIRIPEVIPELSTRSVLTMSMMEGQHLDEWLAGDPSQEMRDTVAQRLWDFFRYFFMTQQRFHADPNPGNYLIGPNLEIGVIDFGCVKQCEAGFPAQLARLVSYYQADQIDEVVSIYQEWGLISKRQPISKIKPGLKWFQEWVTRPFKEELFDFGAHPEYMSQRFSDNFKAVTDIIDNTKQDFVMFDRTYMGLLNIFQKLKARVRLSFD